jgi:hypothetical protein
MTVSRRGQVQVSGWKKLLRISGIGTSNIGNDAAYPLKKTAHVPSMQLAPFRVCLLEGALVQVLKQVLGICSLSRWFQSPRVFHANKKVERVQNSLYMK